MTRLLSVILTIISFTAFSQEWEKNDPRSMESMVFDVVGNKEIKLPPASRMFDPIPPQSYQRINSDLSYSFQSFFYSANAIGLRLRPRPLAAVREDKLYGNYLKAGFGNFGTPFLDVYAANKRQKEFSYGARFNYINSFTGPIDKENSAQGRLQAGVFGSAYGDKVTLTGEASFVRDNLHFYGYQDGTGVLAEDIAQNFNRTDLAVKVKNTSAEDDFQGKVKIGLRNVSNRFSAKETEIYADVKTTLQVLEEAWSHVDAGISSISRNDPQFTGDNRFFFYAKGGLRYQLDDLTIKAMLRVDYLTDTLSGKDGIQLFPVAGIDYMLGDNIHLSAGIEGGVERTTYNGMTAENLFLQEGQYIAAAIKQSGLYANLNIALSNNLDLQGGIDIANYRNSHYFNNTLADQARFEILYDTGSVRVLNPNVSLSYNQDDKYRVNLGLDLYNYSMDELAEAWHRPTFVMSANSKVKLVDKFHITFDAYLLSGILTEESGNTVELDPVTDLNLGIEYFTGSRMSVFLEGRNLTGNNYMLYNHYPVRGLQILGGLTYKF